MQGNTQNHVYLQSMMNAQRIPENTLSFLPQIDPYPQ